MNSLIGRFGLVVAALCGVALAGCNAVEDVRDDPYTAVPAPTVALNGVIYNLGSRRSVTLQNNGNADAARSFVATTPVKPLTEASNTPFTFGSFPVGSPYRIEVKQQPYGKTCTITNGVGTLTTQEALNISITCADIATIPRYAVQVQVPNAFINSLDAKVTLATEEGVFEKGNLTAPGATIACGANLCVRFDNAVISIPAICTPATPAGVPCAPGTSTSATAPAPGGAPGVVYGYTQPVFPYLVTASTKVGGTTNKCQVTNTANTAAGNPPTNPSGATGTIAAGVQLVPTADVTTMVVGLCTFTVTGSVNYNYPYGVAAPPPAMGAGGLVMELKDVQGKSLATPAVATVAAYTNTVAGTAFTFTTAAKSNQQEGILDVVITHQPDGQFCIVGNGAGVSLYAPGATANPTNQTVNVQCRAIPGATKQLKGTYRLTSQTYINCTVACTPTIGTPTNATYTATVPWRPFSSTLQNVASSNLITFFDDGSFLYGTHAQSTLGLAVQLEHGFYDFDPATQKLRFSTVTDTNTGTTIATTFADTINNTSYAGVSATPGPVTFNNSVAPGPVITSTYRVMTGVQVGTGSPRTITGTFGPELSTATTRLSWVLTEVGSVNGEWTGAWVSQDHRRFWVWDYLTNYGMHVGANGGSANVQDACFTTDVVHASSGLYTRRGSSTGCYPYNRPYPGQGYIFNGNEAVDSELGGTAGAVTAVTSLPGFIGRIPGGLTAFDGRSPSPLYFQVAPANQFATVADLTIFPTPPSAQTPYTTAAYTAWCSGSEILGMRATLNGTPIDYPVYFCRYRAP